MHERVQTLTPGPSGLPEHPGAETMLAILNGLEAAYPVATWRVGTIQVWPLLRIRLFETMFQTWHGSKDHRRDPRAKALQRWLRLPLKWARGLARPGGLSIGDSGDDRVDLLVCTDFAAAANIAGLWVDVLAEPLLTLADQQGYRNRCWVFTHTYRNPAKRRARYLQTRLDLAGVAGALRCHLRILPTALDGFEAFLAEIAELGLPNENLSPRYLNALVGRLLGMSAQFRRYLAPSRPKLVAINCYYSLEGMALIHTCRQLGIASLDMQHGVQGKNHAAYGSWGKMPEGGWELLPDHFWCWSQTECQAIEAWRGVGPGPHQPHHGGNLWLESWRNPLDPHVAQVLSEVAQLRALSGSSHHALVSLQWGVDDEAFFVPLIECLRQLSPSWFWWIRLHPLSSHLATDLAERLKCAGLANVNVTDATRLPLPALLLGAAVHITYSSSTVLEAAAFGVPSIVTSRMGLDLFPENIEKGEVIAADLAMPGLFHALNQALQFGAQERRCGHPEPANLLDSLLGPSRPALELE